MSRVREQEKRVADLLVLPKPAKSLQNACPPFPPWNQSFVHCGVHSFLPMLSIALTVSLPPYDLVIWTNDSVSFSFDKGRSGVLTNCSLCGTEAALFFGSDVQVFFC